MRRLLGIGVGLSLLMPTLRYEVRLVDRVTAALGGDAVDVSPDDLTPPIDLASALDEATDFLHNR